MKILICGDINAGKSTLIERLVADTGEAPRGYITVRLPENADSVSNVYLYNIAEPPASVEDAEVIIRFRGEKRESFPEKLDTLGVQYLTDIPEGSLVVLDEIGTLEDRAPAFQKAIFRILDGPYRVLASVKAQNTDFLRAVRRHPDCELFIITPENRERLYRQLRSMLNLCQP